ncbi:Importin subunit alpha, partial [Glycine soja]
RDEEEEKKTSSPSEKTNAKKLSSTNEEKLILPIPPLRLGDTKIGMHMRSSRKVFVELLSKNDELRLQLEALCILTSFASGPAEHRRVIVEVGVLPQLIVFGLGIIASESPSYRDIVLDHGALSPLLHQFGKQSRLRSLKLETNELDHCQVESALPVLCGLIHENDDEDVVSEACWAFSHLSDELDHCQIESALPKTC